MKTEKYHRLTSFEREEFSRGLGPRGRHGDDWGLPRAIERAYLRRRYRSRLAREDC